MSDKKRVLKFPFVNHQVELIIEDEVLDFLKRVGKDNIFDNLNYIVKEIVGNANKANMKRIHFRRKGLDIHQNHDYQEGINEFQEELNENPEVYFQLAEQMGYFVKVNMSVDKGELIIMILNNAALLPLEVKRIQEKFKKAMRFQTLEQVFAEGLDLTEGGGFGIILIILMLRKIGVDEKVFKILRSDQYTCIKVQIPISLVSAEESEVIADAIAEQIESIPQFPPHILELQRILGDSNAEFKDLSEIIEADPTLIADLLKTANSVMYALPKRVESIEEAVKLIGFQGIQNLILTYATQHLLMSQYRIDVITEVMNHSAEVAFYAHELSRRLHDKKVTDATYIGGILHDIGKIMINAVKPDILDRIKDFCRKRGIEPNLLEQLTNGYNHPLIGEKLAEKWNFPDSLNQIIRYHHTPTEAKEEYFPMAASVYLADFIYYYRRDELTYAEANYQVRKYFDITEKADFDNLVEKMVHLFEKRKAVFQ